MRRLADLQTLSENVKRENWEQAKDIFNRALGVAPHERAGFLNAACHGDEDLRRDVETLLFSFDETETFLENPAVGEFAELIADEQPELKAGETVSHYEILKLLGAGGMGEVYLAKDTKLNRRVALKFLPAEAVNSISRKRFQREAQAAAALDHPHICAIYEIAETDGQTFIAMQYVEGETLSDKLKRENPGAAEAVEIAAQIADALSEAHSRGIVHRDIKPANVMLTRRGDVKVLDFGLAKIVSANKNGDTSLSNAGLVMGTAAYMSPEQARGQPVDGRTDVWSLGVVMYEMVAGKQPFAGDTTSDIIAAILKSEPTPLVDFAPDVPEELQTIVSKSLSKNLTDRYASAEEMLADLRRVQKQIDLAFDKTTVRNFNISNAAREKETDEILANLNRENLPYIETVPKRGGRFITNIKSGNADKSERVSNITLAVEESLSQPPIKRKKFLLFGTVVLIFSALIILAFVKINSDATTETAPIDSIAVLPFENTTEDANLEYLSDGITENIINTLSRLPNLRVSPRTTVFYYKNKPEDPHSIGQSLRVRAVLTGKVVQRGDVLTIQTELIDVDRKAQIWGQQYNRSSADVINLQTEIASTIAERLRLRLNSAEQKQLAKLSTDNPEAFRLYLQGRFYLNKRTEENIRKSIEYFNQAVELDPVYALAYTGIADAYITLGSGYSTAPTSDMFPAAKTAVLKALTIDDNLAEAHVSLATIKERYEWDFASAENEYKRAIELNSDYATAHHRYGLFLWAMERFDEANSELVRAWELDPLSALIYADSGVPFYSLRQHEKAIEFFEKALEIEPDFKIAHFYLARSYALTGRHDEAIAEANKSFAPLEPLRPDGTKKVNGLLAVIYAMVGRKTEARALLAEMEKQTDYIIPFNLALIYAVLGEKEQAFAWLEKAYQQRAGSLVQLKVIPNFDNLRDDPRYADLLRRVGLKP